MAISLHDVGPKSYLQTLRAVGGFMDRAASHCSDAGVDLAEIVETSLHPDMRPFRFQIVSVVHHSLGAIEGIRAGLFRPPGDRTAYDFAGLRTRVAEACAAIEAVTPEAFDAHQGADVAFEAGEVRRLFTAEGFLLSFSLPNVHFHAATAYDILRMKGVPLGKRDFIGSPQLKA